MKKILILVFLLVFILPTLALATASAETPNFTIDLTPLLQAILALCTTLITVFLLPWLRAKYTAEQLSKMAAMYRTFVYAAEQMFGAGQGDAKLAWVEEQLCAANITVDRAVLEAEVKKMSDVVKNLASPPTT